MHVLLVGANTPKDVNDKASSKNNALVSLHEKAKYTPPNQLEM